MFCLRGLSLLSRRAVQFRPFSCESFIIQMQNCTDEEQVFGLIERNPATLSEPQVSCAFNMLWQFQKQKTNLEKNTEFVRNHPQFLTLCNATANHIQAMGDDTLVDVLYSIRQFGVESHHPLVEALVTEAWRRLERFDTNVLSVFSTCLADQHLYFSPLMGKIADIVNRNLKTIQDLRALSVLMVSISSIISHCFQERLVNKTELLFDAVDSSKVNTARRILLFLRNVKSSYYPLLERCNKVFMSSMSHLDLDAICRIFSLYQSLQFHSFEFIEVARGRLAEMIPWSSGHPASFVRLFATLGPVAGPEIRKQLKSTMLLMSEDLTSQQVLTVLAAMEDMESRNAHLIKKIALVLYKHLDSYKSIELLKITQALSCLHFQNKELFMKLRESILSHLEASVMPSEICILVSALSMLPFPRLDQTALSRIEAVLPQCDLKELSDIVVSLLRWIQNDHTCVAGTARQQLNLLQKLDHWGHHRLQQSTSLDLLEEVKSLKGEWLHESLVEESVAALEHFVDEIDGTNVAKIASFLSKTNYLSTVLLDRIASVVVQQIEKIHPFSILAVILPFSVLNYDPPQRDEFFGTCVQRFNSYEGKLDPVTLVFVAFSLATLEYFPEDLLKKMFTIEFLARLDSQLEILPSTLNARVQFRLMELNRAVCLECPELQTPWFHDRFCQGQYNKDIGAMNGAQQQIYKMLAEILGGHTCVKASTLSPYYHTVDFECILDKQKKPLPYGSHSLTPGKSPGIYWESNTSRVESRLPPESERIALEFLDVRAFCSNIPHLKGKSAMKKRHLEILGYRVIQVPYFDWNSMALSTQDAKMDYLREHIFGAGKS
ncbi:FAST kinase domain-containing protein 1, mitochondrial [Lemmus lemmus]